VAEWSGYITLDTVIASPRNEGVAIQHFDGFSAPSAVEGLAGLLRRVAPANELPRFVIANLRNEGEAIHLTFREAVLDRHSLVPRLRDDREGFMVLSTQDASARLAARSRNDTG
jgi:hypothetical protein